MPRSAHDAIKATALDYVEGWFQGDNARMRRALSPHLRKCTITRDPVSGKMTVGEPYNNADRMVRLTANGVMKEDGVEVSAEVLYVFRDIAIARTVCPYFEDLLHLANFGEYGWRIVNALWQETEGETKISVAEDMKYWAQDAGASS